MATARPYTKPTLTALAAGHKLIIDHASEGVKVIDWSVMQAQMLAFAGGLVQGSLLAVNVKTYGAVGDGVADDTTAIVNALAASTRVEFPIGTYKITSPIMLPIGAMLLGSGVGKCIIASYGTKAFTTTAESRNVQINNITVSNLAGASGLVGVELIQSRHARISNCEVLDYSTTDSAGIVIDGKDTFAASNVIEQTQFGRNHFGIRLTADAGCQTNHTAILGCYIYGSVALKSQSGSTGIVIERGDSNFVDDSATEDYDVGISIQATDAGGQNIASLRIENCNTARILNPNAVNVIFGATADRNLDEDTIGGSGDGMSFFGGIPYFRLDKTYLSNSKYLRGKSSDGVRWDLVGINNSNFLEIWTPTYDVSKGIRFMCRGDGTELGTLTKAGFSLQVPLSARSTINFQTAAEYTLVRADENCVVSMDNASASVLYIPQNSDVPFPIGTTITIREAGTGQVTVNALGVATVTGRDGAHKLAGKTAYATLLKVDTDAWELAGDITT